MNKELVSYIVILSLFGAYVGWVYVESRGDSQDDKEAVMQFDENIKELAEQGDAAAQYDLGLMYENGRGVPQDYKEAFKWYRKAAEQGDAYAQSALGLMYLAGLGVPQDYKETVKWYRKAAEQGWARAQYNLGAMYSNGVGVPQDHKEAFKWLRASAEQGFADAQYTMGIMYHAGQGVSEDNVQAYMFFNLAASGDHESAANARNKIAQDMSRAQIKEAKKLTKEWANKHPRQ